MKGKFSTVDVFAAVSELQRRAAGMRLVNAYDVDNKTYLLKLQKPDAKCVILFESGVRVHLTECDWPKPIHPSQFSMKLRKHLKQMHLDYVKVLGVDRIVDMCFNRSFTSTDNAFHIIVELYDRGNVLLTDANYNIMNVLRRRVDKQSLATLAVGQRYPIENARNECSVPSAEQLQQYLSAAKGGDNLRKVLVPKTLYGPALLEHCLSLCAIDPNVKLRDFDVAQNMDNLLTALNMAQDIFVKLRDGKYDSKCGCILSKREEGVAAVKRADPNDNDNDSEVLDFYEEYHPVLWHQLEKHDSAPDSAGGAPAAGGRHVKRFDTFSAAVDEFYAEKATQKMQHKAQQQQRDALKKLDNIKRDHEQRIAALEEAQTSDALKAQLIELNKDVVNTAIDVLRRAIADQLDWAQIEELVQDASDRGDPIVSLIVKLNLENGQFSMLLRDPYEIEEEVNESDESGESGDEDKKTGWVVEVDLNYNAYQNAQQYYTHKRQAAEKESKTLAASKKALKSAQVKTNDMLKQVQVRTAVSKKRKVLWFEKFLWFVSSDGNLVLGGRDAQQNELLVKRHFDAGDAYVHADLRGAASVIVKNAAAGSSASVISPRTLSEAGALAVCCSNAWDAKVTAGAWWVTHEQVSRTAPSGEYLTPGSFMIRGKKNFLAPSQLIMGFGFVFRLDEESTQRRLAAKLERQQSAQQTAESVPRGADEPQPAEDNDDNDGDALALSSDSEPDDAAAERDEQFPDVAGVSLQRLTITDGGQGEAQSSEEYSILQLGPKRPEKGDRSAAARKGKGKGAKQAAQSDTAVADDEEAVVADKANESKRGQKHKNKKIKNKYKDQDEEERQLRLELLASAGGEAKQVQGKGKKKHKGGRGDTSYQKPDQRERPQTTVIVPSDPAAVRIEEVGNTDDVDCEKQTADDETAVEEQTEGAADVAQGDGDEQDDAVDEAAAAEEASHTEDAALLASLASKPERGDLLLYALPVCAPYAAMNNFKYKVKLTPGQGKRGKASKLAMQLFIKAASSQCSSGGGAGAGALKEDEPDATAARERDLLKAIASDPTGDVSRNLPGKVKVHAPMMSQVKAGAKKR